MDVLVLGDQVIAKDTDALGRLHIVFFNRSFHPDISATGQLLTDLCEDLVRDHGCRVSVITGTAALRPQGTSVRAASWAAKTYRRHRDLSRRRHALRQAALRRPRRQLRELFPVRRVGPGFVSIARRWWSR